MKQHKSGPQDDGDVSQEDKDQSYDKDKSYVGGPENHRDGH